MRHALQNIGIRVLPKRGLTVAVGALARRKFSRKFIPMYIRHYQIDTSEAELPVHQYLSLTAFFSRRLKPGSRPLFPTGVLSPVDGTVSDFGQIKNDSLVQAKGHTYTLSSLLGGAESARHFEGGEYITLYLSPKDYHRIHMPVDGTIVGWRFIPGSLYPVNRIGVTHIPGLFARNERLITFVETDYGSMAIVKVGATIVGSIQTEYGPSFRNAAERRKISVMNGNEHLFLRRGEELGRFEFGSTVILVFAENMISSFTVAYQNPIRMGDRIARLAKE